MQFCKVYFSPSGKHQTSSDNIQCLQACRLRKNGQHRYGKKDCSLTSMLCIDRVVEELLYWSHIRFRAQCPYGELSQHSSSRRAGCAIAALINLPLCCYSNRHRVDGLSKEIWGWGSTYKNIWPAPLLPGEIKCTWYTYLTRCANIPKTGDSTFSCANPWLTFPYNCSSTSSQKLTCSDLCC